MEAEPKMDIIKEADEKNNIEIVGVERLQSLIERIERLQEEIKEIQNDVKDIFAEAKSCGFDVKIMREIIKLRKMNAVTEMNKNICLTHTKRLWDYEKRKERLLFANIQRPFRRKDFVIEIGGEFDCFRIAVDFADLVTIKNEIINIEERAKQNERDFDK